MVSIRFGGVVILVCAVLAWIFITAGLATNMYENSAADFTPFRFSRETGIGKVSGNILDLNFCGKVKDHIRAIQAFGIMSNLLAVIVAVVGAVAAFIPDGTVPLPANILIFAAAALSLLTSFFVLIAWAIVAGLHNTKICGSKISASSDYGPTLGLWIVAWLLLIIGGIVGAIVGLVVDKVAPPEAPAAAPSKPSNPPDDEY